MSIQTPEAAALSYAVVVVLRGYPDSLDALADRIRSAVTTHPTLSARVDDVFAVGPARDTATGRARLLAAALGDRVVKSHIRSYSDGVVGGAYCVAVAVLPERVHALLDLAAAWATADGVAPTADEYRPAPARRADEASADKAGA